MAPKYSSPSVDAIIEAPENDSRDRSLRSNPDEAPMDFNFRNDHNISLTKSSAERQRDKASKSRRSSLGNNMTRHSAKPKSKNSGASKRINVSASRDDSSSRRHGRVYMTRDEASSNSEDEEEDTMEEHSQIMAAARGRLTSPSLLSTLTSLTTATNHSSSSSGSNSTVTQASISKSSPKTPDTSPVSPAVPDAPDVFAYLEKDDEDEAHEEDHEGGGADVEWSPTSPGAYPEPPLSQHLVIPLNGSVSSSASSSFHSDDGASEKPADNDTDRSTSPEHSVKGEDEPIKGEDPSIKPDTELPTDPAAAKIASQILAAQQRQSMYARHGSRGVSFSPNPQTNQPSRTSPPSQHIQAPARPRPPIPTKTGYEALVTKILSQDSSTSSSSTSSKKPIIKPIYRKFEALNHRLLLQLQDELAELEEKLRVLDQNDTQARTVVKYPSTETRILPASRRASAHAGGDFEWYKMDLINRISLKLNQYNQTLTSFNTVKQSLNPPGEAAIESYRAYLEEEKPIVEVEAKFLNATDDLVVIDDNHHHSSTAISAFTAGPKSLLSHAFSSSSSSPRASPLSTAAAPLSLLPSLACTLAAAVLIPILTFSVIPGYLGRMTVVLLVGLGVVAGLIQAGLLVPGRELLAREGVACVAVYGVLMAAIAGIVA